jgi:mannose-1-phosphate guanylyltransferase
MKAMILAAGKGTRVRPLTHLVPKPMIPLLGRPVMEFLVDHLNAHGFDQIIVNTSYLAPQIESYFRDGRRFGVEMAYSFEGAVANDGTMVDAPLGSAGGLRRIQDFSGFFDSTFVVLCGDAIVNVDLTAAVAAHRTAGAIATLVTKRVRPEDVSSYGMVVADPDGRIRSFQEKPQPSATRSTMASTGIYVFEPSVFDFIPREQPFDIGSQLFPALLAAEAPFYAVELPFQWIDIGNTADFWIATMKLLRGEIAGAGIPGREIAAGVHVGINVSLPTDRSGLRGPIWIGGSAAIADGATIIGPAAIGPGSVVERGAVVEGSIVWDYTRISGHVELRDRIVCGPYCVTSEGASIVLAESGLTWALDDARRARRIEDEHGIGEFVAARLAGAL